MNTQVKYQFLKYVQWGKVPVFEVQPGKVSVFKVQPVKNQLFQFHQVKTIF